MPWQSAVRWLDIAHFPLEAYVCNWLASYCAYSPSGGIAENVACTCHLTFTGLAGVVGILPVRHWKCAVFVCLYEFASPCLLRRQGFEQQLSQLKEEVQTAK